LLEATAVPQSTVEQLGLQMGSHYAVIGLRELGDGHYAGKHARLVEAVNTYCLAYRWSAASCGVGGAVYVIVSVPKSGTNDPHMRLVDGLGQGLLETCERALNSKVLVAISELSSRLTSAPTLMKQVDRCLELSLGGVSPTGVVTFQGLRSGIALGRAAQAVWEDPMLRFPELEILQTIDLDDGTNYVDTLGAFLMSLGNMRTAAEKLGVHITTLRYRLGRIHQIAGIDVQDADTRMLYGLLLRDGGGEFPTGRVEV
jgi:sugar diacid utilization regulator